MAITHSLCDARLRLASRRALFDDGIFNGWALLPTFEFCWLPFSAFFLDESV
jgi:hypothetical protein